MFGGDHPAVAVQGFEQADQRGGASFQDADDPSLRPAETMHTRLDAHQHVIVMHGAAQFLPADVNVLRIVFGNHKPVAVRMAGQDAGDQVHLVGQAVTPAAQFDDRPFGGHLLELGAELAPLVIGNAQEAHQFRKLHRPVGFRPQEFQNFRFG